MLDNSKSILVFLKWISKSNKTHVNDFQDIISQQNWRMTVICQNYFISSETDVWFEGWCVTWHSLYEIGKNTLIQYKIKNNIPQEKAVMS